MKSFLYVLIAVCFAVTAAAQKTVSIPPGTLDPARAVEHPALERDTHSALPEQFIWVAGETIRRDGAYFQPIKLDEDTDARFFRRRFQLSSVPRQATLYIAGPRSVRVWLNGVLVEKSAPSLTSRMSVHVFAVNVASRLKTGENVLAIEAVRGAGSHGLNTSDLMYQQTQGKLLAVKLVPAAEEVNAPAILMSDAKWKACMSRRDGWEKSAFNDSSWHPAKSFGGIESSIDLLQWNADAGMFAWPGYDGISPFLAKMTVQPAEITRVSDGDGTIHPEPDGAVALTLPGRMLDDDHAPQMLLDFGREVNGRIRFVSTAGGPVKALVSYGESLNEATELPYLGVVPIKIPEAGTVFGPKSSFRYALVKFVSGSGSVKLSSVDVEAIYYPVKYQGWFESSDPELNRLWEVGAYTAHLCMQDDIWDAPKRDRGRWMGDLDVSGRTINDVFGDRFLMEDTLDRLLGPAPVEQHVNRIPGYSAFWITGEAEYFLHSGDKEQLQRLHQRMVQLMHTMETELDEGHLYANRTKAWPFVDWAPEFNGDSPETRRATQMEFYAAFRQGAWLLRELNDARNAEHFEQLSSQMRDAANAHLLEAATNSYGPRYQTNAMAVFSGLATPAQYDAIWDGSLANVGRAKWDPYVMTPYYGYYVASAMAATGHRREALAWIRRFWGGMLKEGATSFWEGYDPSWFKGDFHASLQADNNSGYFVSLAHGWSSGVTPWLMEQVLGIHSTGPGFSSVDIRPDLLDLAYAKGGEPTPRGLLTVSATPGELELELPPETQADVSVPGRSVFLNGSALKGDAAENGRRTVVHLTAGGHYSFKYQ